MGSDPISAPFPTPTYFGGAPKSQIWDEKTWWPASTELASSGS
jgi:hypothetical protein